MSVNLKDIKGIGPTEKKTESSIWAWLQRDISFSGNSLKLKEKEQFYSEFSVLLTAGLDLRSALKIVLEGALSKKLKEVIEDISEAVLSGSNLSEAMQHTKKFQDYDVYNVQIGEQTGRLDTVLENLQTYYAGQIKQRQQIMSAISYPALILLVAIGAIVFMFNFLVPMFVQVFDRFGGKLPAITQLVINISNFVTAAMPYVSLLILALVVSYFVLLRYPWFKKALHYTLLRLPFIGGLLGKIYSQRVFRSLALLFESKVSLMDALQLVGKMIPFIPYQQAMQTIEDVILHGGKLNEGFAQFSFFDPKTVALVKVGEEVNRLEFAFDKLSQQLSDELNARISTLNTVLEPVLIVFVGVLVGFILVAMYLPMFQLSTSIY